METDHLSDKSDLYLALEGMGDPSPFGNALRRLKRITEGPLAKLVLRLDFPEMVCSKSYHHSIEALEGKKLTKRHKLFSQLVILIDQIKAVVGDVDGEKKADLEVIQGEYQAFLNHVMNWTDGNRTKRLKGRVRLHCRDGVFEIKQSLGRQIGSIDKYAKGFKENKEGDGFVVKCRGMHLKRPNANPLLPGKECVVVSFADRLLGGGATPLALLRLENIWVKDPCETYHDGLPARRLVKEALDEGKKLKDFFEDNEGLCNDYPFTEKRRLFILKASLTVPGKSLYEVWNGGKMNTVERRSVSARLVLATAMRLFDDTLSNSRVDLKGRLIGIDDELALGPLFIDEGERVLLGMRTVTPFLFKNGEKVDSEVVERLVSCRVEQFMLESLGDLRRESHDLVGALEGAPNLMQELAALALPVRQSPAGFALTYQLLKGAQWVCRGEEEVTPQQLLEGMCEPLARVYEAIWERADGDLDAACELLFQQELGQQLDVLSLFPENDPIIEQIRALAGPKEDEGEIDLIPLAEQWIGSLRLTGTMPEVDDQIDFIREALTLPITQLKLVDCSLNEKQLLEVFEEAGEELKKVVFEEAHELTGAALLKLLNMHENLHLSLGHCPRVSAEQICEVVKWHQNRFSIELDGKTTLVPDDSQAVDALILQALKCCEFAVIDALLQLNGSLDSQGGHPLLHLIAKEGSPKAIEYLVVQKEVDLEAKVRGKTALVIAIGESSKETQGSVENIKMLVSLGTDLKTTTNVGKTPLMQAISAHRPEVIKMLIEAGADIYTVTNAGQNILHVVAQDKKMSVLIALHEAIKPDDWDQLINAKELKSGGGRTPLHRATKGGGKECSQVVGLLIKWGADVNALTDDYRYAPIHWAAMGGHVEACKMLREAKADLEPINENMDRPFDLAVRWGRHEVVQFFLELEDQSYAEALCKFQKRPTASDVIEQIVERWSDAEVCEQILLLQQLGEAYAQNGKNGQAAEILAAALHLADKYKLSGNLKMFLERRLEGMEGRHLKMVCKRKMPSDYSNYVSKTRWSLAEIRKMVADGWESVEDIREAIATNGPMALEVTQTRLLICKLAEHCVNLLAVDGAKPPPYALLGLGSVRNETLSCSAPIELVILLGEESSEARKWAGFLSDLLEIKVASLGETGWRAPGTKEKVTPRGFRLAFKPIVATTEELLVWEDFKGFAHSPERAEGLRNAFCLLGDEELGTSLSDQVETVLKKKRSEGVFIKKLWRLEQARALIRRHVCQFDGPRLGNTFSVTDELLRPFQTLIGACGLLFGVKGATLFNCIQELAPQFLAEGEVEKLTQCLARILKLRHEVGEEIDAENEEVIQIYIDLLPLHRAVVAFVKGKAPSKLILGRSEEDKAEAKWRMACACGNEVLLKKRVDDLHKKLGKGRHPEMALALRRLGDFTGAMNHCNPADKSPELAAIDVEYARMYLKQAGEESMARSPLLEALKIYEPLKHKGHGEQMIEVLLELVRAATGKASLAHAEQALDTCQELFGEEPHLLTVECHRALSRCFVDGGDLDRGIESIRTAIEVLDGERSAPEEKRVRLLRRLGSLLLRGDKPDEAVKKFEQAWTLARNGVMPVRLRVNILQKLARAYSKVKQYEPAIKAGKRAVALMSGLEGRWIKPNIAREEVEIGIAYHELGKEKEAEELLARALGTLEKGQKLSSTFKSALERVGQLMLTQGDAEAAIGYFSLLVKQLILGEATQRVRAFEQLAQAYALHGNHEEALNWFGGAIELVKEDPLLLSCLKRAKAESHIALDDLLEARNLLRDAIQLRRNEKDEELARCYLLKGQLSRVGLSPKKALRECNKALELTKGQKGEFMVKLLNEIGSIYVDLEEWDKAYDYKVQAFNQAVPTDEEKAELEEKLADLAYKVGNIANAIRDYNRALTTLSQLEGVIVKPQLLRIRRRLGDIYFQVKEFADAVACYSQVMASFEKLEFTKEIVKEYLDLVMKLAEAHLQLKNSLHVVNWCKTAMDLKKHLNPQNQLRVLRMLLDAYSSMGRNDACEAVEEKIDKLQRDLNKGKMELI